MVTHRFEDEQLASTIISESFVGIHMIGQILISAIQIGEDFVERRQSSPLPFSPTEAIE